MRLGLPASLYWRLLLSILPLVALAVGGIATLQYRSARGEILEGINRELRVIAQRKAANIDELLRQRRDDLFTLSESPLISDYYQNIDYQLFNEAESYRRQLESSLLSFAARSGAYEEIIFLNERGRTVCLIRDQKIAPEKPSAAGEEYFTQIRGLPPGGSWASPLRRKPGSDGVFYFVRPIHSGTEFKGALVLVARLEPLRAVLRWAGRNRAVLKTPEGDIFGSEEPLPDAETLQAESPVQNGRWTLVIQAPVDAVFAPLLKVRDAAAATLFFGLVFLIATLLLLVRSITRPIRALVSAAKRIGTGDLGYRILAPIPGDLGLLSGALNEMAENLEANRRINAQLQTQLIQAEKLSAVGQLISSVAHELNNPLAAVLGYAQIWLDQGCPPEMRDDLQQVYGSALRCRKVVENLLFFVRQGRQEKTPVNLNDAARSALELLDYRLTKTEDVAIAKEMREDLPEVIADVQQIVQVLVNLVNNACDAMEAASRYPEGKRIRIATDSDDAWAFVTISDNGAGIASSAQGQIFEPFFTTKGPGKGTGLGLSISQEIIKQHGGSISFKSREGVGTSFEVRLPLDSNDDLSNLKRPEEPPPLPAVPGRRILIVDDEHEFADLMARVLREDDDHVEVPAHVSEALGLVADNDYDLIISDIEMEKIKGQDIFVALSKKTRLPETKILFVTGDILNPKVLEFLSKTKCACLVKPFDLEDLRQTVRRLLAGS